MSTHPGAACRSRARMSGLDLADRTGQTGRGSPRFARRPNETRIPADHEEAKRRTRITARITDGGQSTRITADHEEANRDADHRGSRGIRRVGKRAPIRGDPRPVCRRARSAPRLSAPPRDPRDRPTTRQHFCKVLFRPQSSRDLDPTCWSTQFNWRSKMRRAATRADADRACRFLAPFAPQTRRNLRETTGV